MDEFADGHLEGIQYERGEIAKMLRDQADKNLARGREDAYYVLRDAARRVEGRGQRGTFECRVYAATRRYVSEIPVGNPVDLLAGHIIAHDEATGEWCFFGGYPTHEDENGVPHWDVSSARRVTL
jgi:hypothetical protein